MSSGAGGSDDKEGTIGQMQVRDANSDTNQRAFHIEQALGEIRTMFHGKIVKVHGGGLDSPPTVDVQPLVKQRDGAGKTSSHGTIYGIPVTRSIGGDSVIINDPAVGDVGIFSVADRDGSSAQANDWAEANPGSERRFDFADATYHGPLPRKSDKPKQYIFFNKDGVDILDRSGNTIKTRNTGINLNGAIIDSSGNITTPGNMTAGKGTADQVDLQGHAHGTSGPPTPGS